MDEKIYKKDNTLHIEIPMITKRSNPYDPELDEDMPAVIALIENENEMGLCYTIDMSYKGKGDQWTDYFFKWFGMKEEFEKLCEELGIDIVYYAQKETMVE